MSNLKEIRSRVSSIKNTQKITKAMKMVSAAKFRKAKTQILELRAYADHLYQLISDIAVNHSTHPLLKASGKKSKNLLLVVVASDRGLCGGFNSNILKYTKKFLKDSSYKTVDVYCLGKKIENLFPKRPISSASNLNKDISYDYASKLSKKLLPFFLQGNYDEIRFVYNEFVSAITQKQTEESLLPLDLSKSSFYQKKTRQPVFFEPDAKSLIETLIEKHFSVHVYRVLLESIASEHAARMTAMENATKNATEMMDRLTLTYNKLRQASITKELIEICSGAEAVQS